MNEDTKNQEVKKETQKPVSFIFQGIYFLLHSFFFILKYLYKFIKIIWYWTERILLFGIILGLMWWFSQKPSLYRDWSTDQAVLPEVSFSWSEVSIKNIRNFTYTSTTEYTPWYYNTTYNINDIERVYFIVEPFSTKDGPAHTMFSFSFSGGKDIAVSTEIRKEKWESFDPFLWMMNQYEIVNMVWDEKDLIKLRTNYRKDKVFMYPIKAEKEDIQALFISVMKRTDKLNREPEFYNTLWNSCSTWILGQVNALRKNKISWSKDILLPAHSDKIAYDFGLIDTKLSYEDARAYYQINELAEKYAESPDFSKKIRPKIK
jgi:hypothetical protein